MTRRAFIAVIVLLLVASIAYATIYTHRWSYFTVNISQPHVWFEDPQYPNVVVELSNYKTSAIVNISARNMGLRLVYRTGLVYDLTQGRDYVLQYFQEYGQGCNFYYTSDGSGIAVTGNPGGGLYGGCTLRYKYPPGVIANISFTALMKTDDTGSPIEGIRGVSLWNSTSGYYYLAGIKNNKTGWFFGIYKYTGTTTTITEPGGPVIPALVDTAITGLVTSVWFSVSFQQIIYPNGTVVLKAWLYNVTGGGLVAYLERIDSSPIYSDNFGLTVYQIRQQPSAVFQIVGFTTETRVLIVKGLPYCCYVYIYDSSGGLIGSGHVNESGIVEIPLVNPAVTNATISVSCGEYTYNYTQSILLGGDVFEVYFWFEGPVLMVYTDILDMNFTGWLRLYNASCNGSIYSIKVWLVNQTATSSSINITQDGNLLVYPDETSLIILTPQSTGWASNVTLRAELYYNTYCTLYTYFYYNYSIGAFSWLDATINIKGGP